MMGSRTNRYRSGGKNPHLQVLVSALDDGSHAVTVFDTANLRLQHGVLGQSLTESGESNKIESNSRGAPGVGKP